MSAPNIKFAAGAVALVAVALLLTRVIENEYAFFAGYVVLQFIVLATAWNILGGYAGYVNFGSGAFFAVVFIASFAAGASFDPAVFARRVSSSRYFADSLDMSLAA